MDSPARGRGSRPMYSNSDDVKRDRYSPDRREGRPPKHAYYESRDRDHDSRREYADYRPERPPIKSYRDEREISDQYAARGERTQEYTSLCVSNLSNVVDDLTVRDQLYHEYRKFGDFGVKVTRLGQHRVAYLNFRDADDARDARYYKAKLILFDKTARVEPVYSRRRREDEFRDPREPRTGRSRSPEYRSRGPEYPPPRRDYPPGPEYEQRSSRSNGNDKFPHHLQHVSPEDDDKATRTLFIGNLDYDITDGELRHIFARYGLIEDIDIKRPPKGQGNAYAFLRFINLDCAHQAKVDMSGKHIGKFQCKIGYGKATPSNCLWIGGIGPWILKENLELEFDRFGAIKRIEWPPGKTFAYILYDSQDAATAACQEMRGFPLGGVHRRIRVDFAEPMHMDLVYQTVNLDGRRSRSPDYHNAAAASDSYNNQYRGSDSYDSRGPPPPRDDRPPPSRDLRTRDHENSRYDDRKRSARSDEREDRRRRSRTPDRHHSSDQRTGKDQRNGSPDGKRRRYDDSHRGDDRRKSAENGGSGHGNCSSKAKDDKNLAVAEHVDNLLDLAKCMPVVWTGALMLKSSAFPARMHFVSGDLAIVDQMMKDPTSSVSLLRITQRLRLEQTKLDEVTKKVTGSGTGHCVLLAMPSPNLTIEDATIQQRPLRNLVTYLKQKEAAGVINLPPGVKKADEGVLHAFPPCEFGHGYLLKRAPNLGNEISQEDHLLVIVVQGQP